MKLLVFLGLFVAFAARAGEFQVNGQKLVVPDGFEVDLVAGPPLVDRPIVADFDELGRLYVADSSGSNDKLEKQLVDRPHRIVRLEDTDGDGSFDRSVVFADKMMFPEGAMWLDGSLYVAAPPSIWKLTDTNGDGVADQREEWFKGGTLTGCGNDLHGPYRGPDGWIYWCKGAFAKQTHEVEGKPFISRAAHIFRARPDGSRLEPVMTGGMDNPVEVAFTREGERIFTTTFFQHPAAGQRDGLIHAIYGGVYGKPHDVLDGHVRTGELMPVLTHLGAAAPTGLVSYRSRSFGAEYENDLFAALFNLHKVTRHQLQPDGASYKTRDDDFLTGESTDFHPTDVIEAADGSLLVIDTGGWYKLCCPTSQLHKPDVLGAIYRVRRKDAPKVEDPRGERIAWEASAADDIARLLGDPRPVVRDRAIQTLAKKGAAGVPPLSAVLKQNPSEEARRNAVWALTRINLPAAREAARIALADKDNSVRHVAAHSVSVWRDRGALGPLVSLLQGDEPQLQRVAAEALGRLGDRSVVAALLGTARGGDRVLEHSIIYSLIELGDPVATAAALHAGTPAARKAALIALDQMSGGNLQPDQVTPWLASHDAEMKKTALWIVSRHPDWGDVLVPFLAEQLVADTPDSAARAQLLSALAEHAAVQNLLAKTVRNDSAPKSARLLALRAMGGASVKEPSRGWRDALANILATKDPELLLAAVDALRMQPEKLRDELRPAMLEAARHAELPAAARVTMLAAVRGGLPAVDAQLFELLRDQLQSSVPTTVRTSAAAVLGAAKLSAEQQHALIDPIKHAGPFEISKLLGAFENCTDETVGLELVRALREAPGLASLSAGTLAPRIAKFPETVRREADALLATLGPDPVKQRAHLEELAVGLKAGDVRRGQALFNSAKAACSTCHAIGYLGGQLGPDLTRIGQIRTERDLLEAVVFPSASFVRSYEPTLVTTKSGEVYNGHVREESADTVVLAIPPPANEVRLSRADIAEMQPGTASLMPQGFDQILSREELADLITFLKAAR